MTERENVNSEALSGTSSLEGRPAGVFPRPRSKVTAFGFAAPPPDPTGAEALYYEGMAAYQHRNWEEALDRFSRLKELQPTRPGLDALLDEVRWFLQLSKTLTLQVVDPRQGEAVPPPSSSLPSEKGDEGTRRPRWQTPKAVTLWGLPALAVIGVVALALIALQGHLPWSNAADRQAQELYNRGQARLTVGDYEGAQSAFQKLLEVSPNDPEALLGLNRARRLQTLAQEYATAEAAIAEEDWDAAAAALDKVLALDSSYADAQAKADFVAQRRRLAALYSDASRLYDLGQWEDAIVQFEKIRALDDTYRTEAIAEFLFVCYHNAGHELIERADGDAAKVQQAITYFSNALAIHPRNRLAADARRLGSLYLEAVRAMAAGNLADAHTQLEALLAETPTYANGQAARQLYDLLLKRAEEALRNGDIQAGIRFYQQAQTVAVADHSAAITGEAYARAITPTPTPTYTPTPRPTPAPITPTPYAVVRTGVLNLRAGPGIGYPVVGQVRTADSLAIIGRNADDSWLRVCVSSPGGEASGTSSLEGCALQGDNLPYSGAGEVRGFAGQVGWVAAGLVDVQGMLALLPVVTPPALPTATPTRRPATPARQVVCIAGNVLDVRGQPLVGWTVVLQPPAGPAQTARTSSTGFYRFANLSPGTYTVSEQLNAGWRAISPQSTTVVIAPADICYFVDFWNEKVESAGPQPPTPTATPRPTDVPTAEPPTPTPPR
jgi:tetratricopeptide (TPR) repeat protein